MEQEKARKDRVFGAGSRIRRREIDGAMEILSERFAHEPDFIRRTFLMGAIAGMYFQYVDEGAETYGDGLLDYLENAWLHYADDAVVESARKRAAKDGLTIKDIRIEIGRKGDPDGR
ncbi:MAG: hypothetical protein U0M51_01995 [Eggerthellaceae bacterium]